MPDGHRELHPSRHALTTMEEPPAGNSPAPPPLPSFPMAGGNPAGVSEDEKVLGMLCHLLGILTGFLGPLVLWLVKKDSSAFLDHHGREALNFQITVMLVMFGLGSVTFALMFLV